MLTANVTIVSDQENVNQNVLESVALPSKPLTDEDLAKELAMEQSDVCDEVNAKLAKAANAAKHQPKYGIGSTNSEERDEIPAKKAKESDISHFANMPEMLTQAMCKIVTDVAFENRMLIRTSDSYYQNGTTFQRLEIKRPDNPKQTQKALSSYTVYDKDTLTFNNGLDCMLAWLRSWMVSKDLDIFEQHITNWWDAQPDDHFMSKKSGCKAEHASECPWPISQDIVAPDVILLDYNPDRVCHNDPQVRFGSTFFPNKKNMIAQTRAQGKQEKEPYYMNVTSERENLWYFKSSDGGQISFSLKKTPSFVANYQRCQILYMCHLAKSLSENKTDPAAIYVVIMTLCSIMEKCMFGEKATVPRSYLKAYQKIKEAIAFVRAGLFTNLDAHNYGCEILKHLMKGTEETLKTIEKIPEDIREIKNVLYKISEANAIWPLIMSVAHVKFFSILDLQTKMLRHEYIRLLNDDDEIKHQALDP